jgi:hypothetical protein
VPVFLLIMSNYWVLASIGPKRLSIDPALFKLRSGPSGGFFTDSGSPYTVFTISAYSILRQEMVQYICYAEHYGRSPIEEREGPLDLCYKSSQWGHATYYTSNDIPLVKS